MSKITPTKFSEADMHSPLQHKSHRGAQGGPRKNNKKPMKSNITNKVKSKHAGVAPSGDVQSEDDDGDGSSPEDSKANDDEADEFALSGAGKTAQRLAGRKTKNQDIFQDITMMDAGQVTPGAGMTDEEDYADVENVSDSEASESEAEDNILLSAEQDLIQEFEKAEQRRNANVMTSDMKGMGIHEDEQLARRLNLHASDTQTDEFGFGVDLDEDPFLGLSKDADQYTQMWNDAETAIWRMPDTVRGRESGDQSNSNQKRVRFEETRDRSSSRSDSDAEDPNDTFPDLLAASDHPLAKQPEYDYGINYGDFNDAESFYDFEDEDEKLAFQIDEESDSIGDGSGSDSDDEGDTTDEESTEEQIARMEERKAACKQGDSSCTPEKRTVATPVHSRTTSTSRPTTPRDGKGPRIGTFARDPTRACMTTDPNGGNIQILPPSRPSERDRAFWERARTANSSRSGSPRNGSLTLPSPRADTIPSRPFTAQSTLGSMFNGNLDILRNNDVNGIAEDLFPAVASRPESSFTSISATEDSDTDRHVDMDMEDFLHLPDGSESDSESPPSGTVTSPGDADIFTSFTPDNSRERRSSGLLEHFDQCRGVVGSFRRNQAMARQVSSLASHPATRASAHEFNALQKGRRGAANTPMTPARKKRASQDLTPSSTGVRKNVSSPLSTARRPRSRGNSLANNPDLFQTLARNPLEHGHQQH